MESEPAGRKHLEHSARHLAKSLTITANRPRGLLLLERLTENTRKLVAAYRRFNRAPEDALTLSYTAEWILDNFYVVQRAERQLLEDLPPSYYRQLPKLANSPMVGYPRIYALARACLARCQGNLDLASVRHFVTAFQRVTPLTMGELWALPSMLRLAAIDKLAHAVTRVADIGVASNKGTTNGIPPRATSEEDAIVADSIRALRLLETSDWRVFFESVSQVEQILRSDPAGVYAKMDPGTRDRYRKVIEILASATGMVEPEVATVAIRIAAQAEKRLRSKAGPGTPSRRPLPARAAHVGFYLMDGGRKELEQVLGYRPSVRGRMRRWIVDHATFAYLGSILLATSGILVAACSYVASAGGNVLQVIAAGMLLAIAAVSVVVDVLGWLITHLLKPLVLPQLDFRKGLPEDQRTMVVMPALLANAEEVDSLLGNLELHFLRNTDPNIFFALLTDFCDAPREAMPGDETLVAQAKAGIRHLNNKYAKQADQPFFLFHRRRLWNPGESCWMGWERKRGKLMEFNRLLRECPDSSFSVQLGQLGLLPTIRYVITLDADTDLTRGSARRLVATLAHPLNRAEFDSVTGVVRAGYTVLQPRVEVRPTSAHRSRFVEIFAQAAGPDLYTRAVSDAYQDLFGEGSFVGKGIYDVDAFMRSLDRRIPENTILSHDMLEGLYGRAGLLTGVVMYEDYPPHYPAYTRRWHRWVRGDWQLLPLLLPGFGTPEERRRRVGLSALDRWKILDNLRRSMLGPGLLALLVSGWTWLPGSALMWTLFGISIPAVPALIDVLTVATGRPRGRYLLARSRPLRLDSLRWLLAVSFLPFEALLAVDAIARTLARLAITRRHLLQWTTAASTLRALGQGVTRAQIWKQMIGGPVASLGITALVEVARPTALPIAAPLLIAWLVSPQIAYWVGRPRAVEQTRLSPEERQALCRLARRTWLFFEQFVGPSDHWLPPDHFQEEPKGVVAHRTSPTNIGLMLLSTLTAFDFGFIGFLSLEYRLRDTFRTLNRLTRYRGHFLNWYNTSSLEPLPPAYVSTVDSGNLAGCLLTLRQGCLGLAATPLLRWERRQGLLDTLAVLIELLDGVQAPDAATHLASLRAELKEMRRQILEVRDRPGEWASLVTRLADEVLGSLDRHLLPLVTARPSTLDASRLHNLRIWIRRVHHHLDTSQRELNLLMPWLTALSQPPELLAQSSHPDIAEAWRGFLASLPVSPRLDGVAVICGDAQERLTRLQAMLADQDEATKSIKKARDWCTDLTRKLRLAATRVEALLQSFLEVSNQAAAFVQDMDFRFLFDSRRHLLHIGYNTETESLDENYYDLMASEARLASYVAIAKGDVPQSHWLHLGRPLTQVDHSRALLSWTGTMFEYLMPTLMMRSFEGSLVDQSNHAAVDFQIRYCEQRGVPWGVSESGYYRFDTNRNYQYRAFGVEGLGLKRGLGEDLVISPYASLLALPIRPGAVLHNLGQLAEMKMLGPFGFYEALDFTPSRLATGQPHALVKSYMAHHQGMILLSLANLLQDRKMINRFHADPRVQSIELLLQEDLPRDIPLQPTPPDGVGTVIPTSEHSLVRPWQVSAQASPPMVHYLSNGRYGLMVTAAGAGYSHWQGMDLTRWRSDTSLDDTGSWIYLRDEDSKELWSATAQPIAAKKGTQEAFFYPHQVTFHRREHDLAIETDLTIPPEDDIEVRRLRLISHSTRPRRLSLTSYAEVTLASHDIDSRHEAFNKLFIESEFLPGLDALMFRRRLRSPQETPVYLIHMLVQPNGKPDASGYESDRSRFLGRGRSVRAPAALSPASAGLTGTTGVTLDPIMALSQEIQLPIRATREVAFVTCAAGSRDDAIALASRYRSWSVIELAFSRARTQSELELRRLHLDTADVETFQRLLSVLLYPHEALRAPAAVLAANRKGQSGLWPFAISGDHPILMVCIESEDEVGGVTGLLRAHAFWRARNLEIDLVILNTHDTGYTQELEQELRRRITRSGADSWLNQPGGIFLLRADQMSEAERILLETASRAVLDAGRGPLHAQVSRLSIRPSRLPAFVPSLPKSSELDNPLPVERPSDLVFDNGLGGFSADGREYVIYLESNRSTPAPWINVIANPEFGFLVDEQGGGSTWALNASENRLTAWHNDPLTQAPGEALYLRDEEGGEIWSPTPQPVRAPSPYLVRHGAGYTRFEHHSHGLRQTTLQFAALDEPVKLIQVRLENTSGRQRRITATYYAAWVLGRLREQSQQFVVTEFDPDRFAVLAWNSYNEEFGDRVAFLAADKEPHGVTADRTEFLGPLGSLGRPAALGRVGLAGSVGAGLDPCAALQLHLDLAPGQTEEVCFLIGQGADAEQANVLIEHFQTAGQAQAEWQSVIEFWDSLLSHVTVATPDPAMDLLLNRWLLYQTLSSRVWGRSALYQSSGAFGFRDQLQDVMSLFTAAPETARGHILEAAHHQFEEGDVLHWWHPPSGRGIRTRTSDDLLWLPFVTAHYVASTGDESILTEKVPFLSGSPLEPEEVEHYGHFKANRQGHALFEHCLRAVEKGTTAGPHGLPLMGSGDWNDGMNRVGIEGRGESIWLGWFLHATLVLFADLCERIDKADQALDFRSRADDLLEALESHTWDGNWYLRAFYDNGATLGSAADRECRIDSIAQSWAVLSGAADPKRAERAMDSVVEHLVRHGDSLLELLAPPFDQTPQDPGYIKGYPPGVRENGGQYTHGALWVAGALAALGKGDQAGELFRMLNPVYHTNTPEAAERYRVEPYVVAADVYSLPPHTGRGGWTWYTGSAAWMYRVGLEAILGCRRLGSSLTINPCIPSRWPGFQMIYRYGSTRYEISVDNSAGVQTGVEFIELDGNVCSASELRLSDDGRLHMVRVVLGRPTTAPSPDNPDGQTRE